MITLEPPRSMVSQSEASSVEAWRALGLSRAGLGRFLRAAQTAVGLRGEVAVLLSDDRTLRRLNREFRGKDKATDVLSFPADRKMARGHAGDLAISLETAALHGVLHLAGMDHEADRGEMAKREAMLRKRFGLRSGLISRSGVAA